MVIDRPVADVWAFVSDLAMTPQWRTTVTSVTPPTELAAGSEFEATTRLLGRGWQWRLRITSVEPERVLSYQTIDGVADIEVEYRLARDDAGCHFALAGRSRPSGPVSRLVDRAGAWKLRREIEGQLQNLKRILEAPLD